MHVGNIFSAVNSKRICTSNAKADRRETMKGHEEEMRISRHAQGVAVVVVGDDDDDV